jgi:GTP-binding protein EngB required for normal cell division
MIEWLKSRNLESFVILSKSDKLSRSQALRRRKEIAVAIGVDQPDSLIILSTQNKTGIDELRDRITSFFYPDTSS